MKQTCPPRPGRVSVCIAGWRSGNVHHESLTFNALFWPLVFPQPRMKPAFKITTSLVTKSTLGGRSEGFLLEVGNMHPMLPSAQNHPCAPNPSSQLVSLRGWVGGKAEWHNFDSGFLNVIIKSGENMELRSNCRPVRARNATPEPLEAAYQVQNQIDFFKDF